MASVIEVYKNVNFIIHEAQSGDLNYRDFNLQSKIAELKMLGWLTGSPKSNEKPTPFDNQKSRSWLSPILIPYGVNVVDGKIKKPADFYYYGDLYSLDVTVHDCEEDDKKPDEIKKIPIELLDPGKFNIRANTNIKLLKPSIKKPIAKEVGLEFYFLPEDLGAVTLDYYSYPSKYGQIITKEDHDYNDEVPDPDNSIDYVWGDWAIEILSWFILDSFSNRTRDAALKNSNTQTGKLPV